MITKTAHAKINLTLEIMGRRQDGYHELDMIFLEIGMGDIVTAEKTEAGITLLCSDASLPSGEGNLAYKAAGLMKKTYGILEGVKLCIEKNIPSQAGLGGGSSDAACVMNCINELFSLDAGPEELERLAAQLGSDVPFFIRGGCKRAKGRGEELIESFEFPPCAIAVVKPDLAVSTPWAYKAYDELAAKNRDFSATDAAAEALRRGDYAALCASLYNDLERPVFKRFPEIEAIKRDLLSSGADAALMTGSGSAVFALYSDPEKTARAGAVTCFGSLPAE